MTLAPLATTADLFNRDISDANEDTALAVASSMIRDAAGCAISEQTSTVTVTGSRANLLALPGPVTSVTSVTIGGETVDSENYEVLPNGLWRSCGWTHRRRPAQVTVTFTHGLATVPDDIVDLTCQLAKAWLNHANAGGGSMAGVQSVGIDDARESYTAEAAGQVSPVFIPEATRQWLSRRFSGGIAVVETL